jgi:hypothetical protein
VILLDLLIFFSSNHQGTFPHRCYSNPVLVDFYSVSYAIRCLILQMNGELSVMDMDDGHEHALTNSVELFWVTCSQSEEKGSLFKEVSWLDYGHRGMQVRYTFIFWYIYARPRAPLFSGIPLATPSHKADCRSGTRHMDQILLSKKSSCRYKFPRPHKRISVLSYATFLCWYIL